MLPKFNSFVVTFIPILCNSSAHFFNVLRANSSFEISISCSKLGWATIGSFEGISSWAISACFIFSSFEGSIKSGALWAIVEVNEGTSSLVSLFKETWEFA